MNKLFARKKGQGLVEYELIMALVSVVALTALFNLGSNYKSLITECTNKIQIATASAGTGPT